MTTNLNKFGSSSIIYHCAALPLSSHAVRPNALRSGNKSRD